MQRSVGPPQGAPGASPARRSSSQVVSPTKIPASSWSVALKKLAGQAPDKPQASFLLDRHEVNDDLQDPSSYCGLRPLLQISRLHPKPIPPDRHITTPMPIDRLTAVNHPIRRPEGEFAVIFLGYLRQVCRCLLQHRRDRAMAFPVDSVADRTVPAKFKFSRADGRFLLCYSDS